MAYPSKRCQVTRLPGNYCLQFSGGVGRENFFFFACRLMFPELTNVQVVKTGFYDEKCINSHLPPPSL